MFPSDRGKVAQLVRKALGTLIVQPSSIEISAQGHMSSLASENPVYLQFVNFLSTVLSSETNVLKL